ncbi:expressed unknown protein [Seminavis robusta]|uniref:Uncharacterized protein n=1 Tax=Seminavis robusta TaxID=568900 RepID=A0A9N8HWW2_9STRA|nr:expressed unknown protein [Seminavis robusta]|eukprot:Sro2061_g312960.1 n/a (427) ;mRNA; f:5836-7116
MLDEKMDTDEQIEMQPLVEGSSGLMSLRLGSPEGPSKNNSLSDRCGFLSFRTMKRWVYVGLVLLLFVATSIPLLTVHFIKGPTTCQRLEEKSIHGQPINLVDGNRTIWLETFIGNGYNIGNALSEYWASRALAQMGGYNLFRHGHTATSEFDGWTNGEFVRFLPHNVTNTGTAEENNSNDPKAFQRFLCNTPTELMNIHEYQYGWSDIWETIQKEEIAALKKYADHRYSNDAESRRQLLGEFYEQDDWFIYDRCCIFCHPIHGFATLSFYDNIPSTGTFKVYSISGHYEGWGAAFCEELHQIRDDYIRARNPNVTIVSLQNSDDRDVDFGRIAFAPNLLIPSAGSSWGLWAAVANAGNVVTVKIMHDYDYVSKVSPPNYHVDKHATVLYNPEWYPPAAKVLGFSNSSTFLETPEGKKKLFDCFINC